MVPALLPGLTRGCTIDDAMIALFKLTSLTSAALALPIIAMVSWWDALPPLVSSIVAAGGVWLTVRQKATTERQTELHRLIDQLQEQDRVETAELRQLRSDFSRLYTLVLQYRTGVARLVGQLEDHDIEPTWRPPSIDGLEVVEGAG